MGAPPQAGIQGLHVKLFNSFKGGRVTNMNLTDMTEEMSLLASNVMFLGDRAVSKRPGYTLVRQYPTASPVLTLHGFQRASDLAEFLLVQQPGLLSAGDVLGANVPMQLSNTEDAAALFSYTDLDFACYLSNGKASHRLVDDVGTLTMFKFGIAAPTVAPAVSLASGTLTLTYGRQYCYSFVSKITDSEGTTRISVSAPSPLSASSGPFTNKAVELSTIQVSADPQVTHVWIFATYDTPFDSTSVFNFALEIATGTTSAADDLPDIDLDDTRPAPFENYPAPLAQHLFQYQSRVIAIGITGSPNWVQMSGFEEILVGIPQEAWPADLIFKIPGGSQQMTGGIAFGNSRMMLCNSKYWFQITGYDASTFQKKDRIMTPGCAGYRLIIVTDHNMLWVSADKKLWAWDGTYPAIPVEISKKLAKPVTGIGLSMEDLSAEQLANCELHWYSEGRYNIVGLVASSNAAASGVRDWIQLWDTSFLGDTLSDNSVNLLAESDFFPSDPITASAIVNVEAIDYLFLGDTLGNIYRWPDGYYDNGKEVYAAWATIWSALSAFIGPMFHPLPPQEIMKQLFFADIQSDRQDCATVFSLLGLCLPSPDNAPGLINCGLGPFIVPYGAGTDPTCARAFLNQKGTSVGRWARFIVTFPSDNNPATLWSLAIWGRPIYGGAP